MYEKVNGETKFVFLDLGKNKITGLGRRHLLWGLFNTKSPASNHTCRVDGIELDISFMNAFDELAMNRPMKIFTVMSAADRSS